MKNNIIWPLFIFFSCSNEADIKSFKVITADSIDEYSTERIDLEGKNVGPEKKFGLLTDILLVNSTIVVQDEKKESAFVGIMDDGDLVSFQPVGEGPDRVANSKFIKMVNYEESSNDLYFFDFSSKSLNSVKIQPDSDLSTFCRIPNKYWGQIQSAINLNDSMVGVTGLFSDTKYIVLNKDDGTEIMRSDYANSFAAELPETDKVALAPTDIQYNQKHDLVILINASINSIDTYSFDGKPNKFYAFGEFENMSEENTISSDYFYYYNIRTQEDIVYGLYLGVERKAIAMQEFFLINIRPELHVFNLLSDKMMRFRLDRIVNACVIDSNNNFIYCIEEDNEDQPLVRYEIPEIL